jgi:hypothetical protein
VQPFVYDGLRADPAKQYMTEPRVAALNAAAARALEDSPEIEVRDRS